jgi:hypothetical protein
MSAMREAHTRCVNVDEKTNPEELRQCDAKSPTTSIEGNQVVCTIRSPMRMMSTMDPKATDLNAREATQPPN